MMQVILEYQYRALHLHGETRMSCHIEALTNHQRAQTFPRCHSEVSNYNYISLAKYLDMKGINASVVEECMKYKFYRLVLDSVSPNQIYTEEDDIEDWLKWINNR